MTLANMTYTPFGPVETSLLQQVCKAAGIWYDQRQNNWVFRKYKVSTEKEIEDSRGNAKLVQKELSIPVRAYNFELNLLKTGDVKQAIKLTNCEYMPAQYDYSSYKKMFEEYHVKYGEALEENEGAKKQAFEMLGTFKENF